MTGLNVNQFYPSPLEQMDLHAHTALAKFTAIATAKLKIIHALPCIRPAPPLNFTAVGDASFMPRGRPTLSALVAARVHQDTHMSQLPTHDRPDRYFDLDTVLVKLLNTTDEPGETQPQAWVYSQSSTQSNWTRHTLSLPSTKHNRDHFHHQ